MNITKFTGMHCGIEKAGETAHDSMFPVTVGSVQSMMSDKRLARYRADHFDCIIPDECHHATADSWMKVFDNFPDARIVGFTATAYRGKKDKKKLGLLFDGRGCKPYNIRWAIDNGWLAPMSAETIPLDIDMSAVKVRKGDFVDKDLGHALEPYLDKIAQTMVDRVSDRKSIAFLPLVDTSKKFTAILNQKGLRACHIDGKMAPEDVAYLLSAYERGQYDVLCNCQMATEGFDCPSINCVVVLRPTKSTGLYTQMVGRGTRPCPPTIVDGHCNLMERKQAISQSCKPDTLLLDFLWHCERHNLCHPADLMAPSAEVAAKMTEIQEKGGRKRLSELEDEAEKCVANERESKLKAELQRFAGRRRGKVDPLQFGTFTHDAGIVDYEPSFAWEKSLVTEAQAQMLAKNGFDPDGMTRGYASKIIDNLMKRWKAKLATPKQAQCLTNFGYPEAYALTFEQAKALMNQCAASGWTKRWN
jgi:superfamily II DNA or RNA helicase